MLELRKGRWEFGIGLNIDTHGSLQNVGRFLSYTYIRYRICEWGGTTSGKIFFIGFPL